MKVEQRHREWADKCADFVDRQEQTDFVDRVAPILARFEASLAPSGLVETVPVPLADLLAIMEVLELAKRIPTVNGLLSCRCHILLATIEGLLP